MPRYLVHVEEFAPIEAVAAAAVMPDRDYGHSPDFASVNWFGQTFTFSPTQRSIVAVLWAAWKRGTPDVHGQTLLNEADSYAADVRDVFRGNPAYDTMIRRSSKHGGPVGCFRLVRPE